MRQIKPDHDWALFCRKDLLERFGEERPNKFFAVSFLNPVNLFNLFDFVNGIVFAAFRLSPAKAVVSAVIMVGMAAGTFLSISQNALPGSTFYSLKLTSEEMALRVALGEEKKFSLHTKFAERRVQEISALSHNAEINAEEFIPVLNEYRNQLASVKEILDSAIKEGNGKAVKLAERVTKETEKYGASLSVVSGTLSEDPKSTFNEALAYTEETNIKALTVLSSSIDGNKEFIAKLREKLEGKIGTIEASLDNVDDEIIYDQIASLVSDAKSLLEEGDLIGALELVSAAEALLVR